jgi:nucleotide-binding universal stress UspA family protein
LEYPDLFHNILACLDGSQLAEQILPFVKAQAFQFKSRLVLLQVIPLHSDNVVEAGATFIDAKLQAEQTQVLFNRATVYLESMCLALNKEGLNTQAVVIKAPQVGQAIVEFARKNHIDLIAIATHGHGGLGKIIFGSIFECVLKQSGIPLLVIKPQNK